MSNTLDIWTVYRNPSDYPDKYVVRKHAVPGGPTNEMYIADSLEEARALLPMGLLCFNRAPTDDPVIVETWL